MKKTLAITFGLLLVAAPAFAGPNPSVVFAMHTIVSDAYLYCADVCPGPCLEIDPSAEESEIAPGGFGYCYVGFGAYNFTNITAVEFAIAGFPTTRSIPPVPAMNYCPEGVTVFGDPYDLGVAVPFGGEILPPGPDCTWMFCFAWISLNMYTWQNYWPVTIMYVPSSYTTPVGSKVAGPPPDYVIDLAVGEHGCTIGGVHPEVAPYPDCIESPTATEESTWGGVKAMYR